MFDSPGVWDLLKRYLDDCEVEQVWKAYAVAAQLGALDDYPVKRIPGASFNPRPARLMHILISEAGERSAIVLGACALVCAPKLADHSPTAGLTTAWELALKVIKWLAYPEPLLKNDTAQLSQHHIALASARILDDLRHLHMTSLSALEREKLISHHRNLIENLPAPDSLQRIYTLIKSAVDRQGRHRGL